MPDKNFLLDLRKSTRDTLLHKIHKHYGRRKTAEETAFTDEIGKKIDQNIIFLFLVTLWVGIVSYSKMFMIEFQHPKISRCAVPELESHFSFEQILNLTVRIQDDDYGHNCYYDKRNYSNYIQKYGYNYTAIMAVVSESSNAYSQKCTGNIVTKINEDYDNLGKFENFQDQTNIYCLPYFVKRLTEISLKYGQLILSTPLGFLGDFYGRRLAFVYCSGMFTLGVIFAMSYHIILVIIGRFLIGSTMILFYTIFVIFVESSSANARRIAIFLHEGIAVGRFVQYMLFRILRKWKVVTIINAVMCLLMLLSYFLFNESARWLYFRGKQQQAFRIIGIEKPEAHNELDKRKLKSHLKMFMKPVFRKRLMIQMITIWCTSSVVFLIRTKFSRQIRSAVLNILLHSGVLMGLCTALTFLLLYFIGRRKSIMLYFAISIFVNSVLFFNPRMDRMLNQLCLVVSVTLTENANFFAFYMISESYPNDIRLTGYGFCCVIHGFGDIFHFHVYSYNIPVSSLYYAPLLLITAVSLACSFFQADSPGLSALPDYPREAMKESDYKSILNSIEYKRRMFKA